MNILASDKVGDKALFARLPDGSERRIVDFDNSGWIDGNPCKVFIYEGEDKEREGENCRRAHSRLIGQMTGFPVYDEVAVAEDCCSMLFTDLFVRETLRVVSGIEERPGKLILHGGEATATACPDIKLGGNPQEYKSVLRTAAKCGGKVCVTCRHGDAVSKWGDPTIRELISLLYSTEPLNPKPEIAVTITADGRKWDITEILLKHIRP